MTSDPRIERYARAFAARLTGPRRARSAIVAEIRDGLLAAIDASVRGGMQRARAVDAAIEEFGDPARLAAAFDAELAAAQSRRVAVRVPCSGPPIGSLWAAALLLGGTVRELQACAWAPVALAAAASATRCALAGRAAHTCLGLR